MRIQVRKYLSILLIAALVFTGEMGNASDVKGEEEPIVAGRADEIPVDEGHFPDAAFRECILNYVDQNGNKTLSENEVNDNIWFDVSDESIKSLLGIEYFPHISSLECGNNDITELDLSAVADLEYLNCSGNSITELDLSGLTELKYLDCSRNGLEKLKITNNKKDNYGFSKSNTRVAAYGLSRQRKDYIIESHPQQSSRYQVRRDSE